jgi:hypothetical protein
MMRTNARSESSMGKLFPFGGWGVLGRPWGELRWVTVDGRVELINPEEQQTWAEL